MKVDLRTKISTLKADFKKEFRCEIEIYKSISSKQIADEDQALHKVKEADKHGGDFEIGGQAKVKTVEKLFADNFGIGVQIKVDGKLADNDATLASLKK